MRVDDPYHIAKLTIYEADDDELGIPCEEGQMEYRTARNGDHFICPFQCDLCHFRNIKKRDPRAHSKFDYSLMVAIRRGSLDAFWGRRSGTVSNTRRGVQTILDISQGVYGINNILPDMGPYRLEDDWGMGIAVCMLHKSLNKGDYSAFVQFATVRKLRSVFSSVWNASVHTPLEGVMAKDTTKIYVTQCPTYSLWFERFTRGLHVRMGDDRRPDSAISVRLMNVLMERADLDYIEAYDQDQARYIGRAGLFFLSTFLGGLRGEEVPRILRKYFLSQNQESLVHCIPHTVLPLYGNFKNDQGVARCHLQRIVCKSKSGLDMEKWVRRVMELEKDSRTMFLFADQSGRKERISKYENYFMTLLDAIQKTGDGGLISKQLDVSEAFGLSRSGRRGATTAAINAPNDECTEDDIKRNNQWERKHKAGVSCPSLDMPSLYQDTLHAVEANLRFPSCL